MSTYVDIPRMSHGLKEFNQAAPVTFTTITSYVLIGRRTVKLFIVKPSNGPFHSLHCTRVTAQIQNAIWFSQKQTNNLHS